MRTVIAVSENKETASKNGKMNCHSENVLENNLESGAITSEKALRNLREHNKKKSYAWQGISRVVERKCYRQNAENNEGSMYLKFLQKKVHSGTVPLFRKMNERRYLISSGICLGTRKKFI